MRGWHSLLFRKAIRQLNVPREYGVTLASELTDSLQSRGEHLHLLLEPRDACRVMATVALGGGYPVAEHATS